MAEAGREISVMQFITLSVNQREQRAVRVHRLIVIIVLQPEQTDLAEKKSILVFRFLITTPCSPGKPVSRLAHMTVSCICSGWGLWCINHCRSASCCCGSCAVTWYMTERGHVFCAASSLAWKKRNCITNQRTEDLLPSSTSLLLETSLEVISE